MKVPSQPDAENSLLGSCLNEMISPPCKPDDFYVQNNQLVAAAMRDLELDGVSPDLVSVSNRMNGKLPPSYLVHLSGQAGSSQNIEHYAKIVREYASLRRVQLISANFVQATQNLSGKKINELLASFGEEVIRASESQEICRDTGMKKGMQEFMACLEDRVLRNGEIIGIPTGLTKLDSMTCGMCPQELWIVAARPSAGKTALALNIAVNVAKAGRKVLIFSLDMTKDGLYERMTATESEINLAKIRSGNLFPDELSRAYGAAEILHDLPITITDVPATEIDIIHKTRRYRPDLLVVDFLTKIQPARKTGNAHMDYGDITRVLKDLGKTMNIPVLVLAQLNRLVEREKRRPQNSDLRESGQIEEHADVILFIHTADNQQPERELILSKQRQGRLAIMKYMFDGGIQKFEPVEITI